MREKPQGELNNKFITISVSDTFREMVNRLHWQFQMSKSRFIREAVIEFAKKKLEGCPNENKEG